MIIYGCANISKAIKKGSGVYDGIYKWTLANRSSNWMATQKPLRKWLAQIADAIDEGGPLHESILLGMPFVLGDGKVCEVTLSALGFKREGIAWIREKEHYFIAESDASFGKILLPELEAWRETLLKRAEKYGVAVYIPSSAQVLVYGLGFENHPVRKMLVQAPSLRLLFAPGTDHHGELAFLLSTRAVTWPQAMRISLEAHASYPVSPNAQANLVAARQVILRETKAQDRSVLLEELAMRYGKSHPAGVETDKDEEFLKALEPYLRKAFLHE